PSGVPVSALVALAIGIGLATPPVGACTRALLPDVLRDASSLRAAYAFESSALELTFVAAPPLALGLGALWSTGAALAFGGIVLLLATAAFARQPVSRSWRPWRPAPCRWRRRRAASSRSPPSWSSPVRRSRPPTPPSTRWWTRLRRPEP